LELNPEARLYGWSPLDFIGRDVYWARSWWRERPELPAPGADVKITINHDQYRGHRRTPQGRFIFGSTRHHNHHDESQSRREYAFR
jgi:hypothetical protein